MCASLLHSFLCHSSVEVDRARPDRVTHQENAVRHSEYAGGLGSHDIHRLGRVLGHVALHAAVVVGKVWVGGDEARRPVARELRGVEVELIELDGLAASNGGGTVGSAGTIGRSACERGSQGA